MASTESLLSRIPPLIHGEFESSSGRTTSETAGPSPSFVELVSAAEINYRTGLFKSLESDNIQPHVDHTILSKASTLFSTGRFDGQDFEQYCQSVATSANLSLRLVRDSSSKLAQAISEIPIRARSARRRNSFSLESLEQLASPSYGLMQVRKGDTLFVNLPGNSPGPNSVWIEALLYGYKVILRPSIKDPFTPLRLSRCLIQAGVPKSSLSILYCNHDSMDQLVDRCDLSILFGGIALEERYKNRTDVKIYGPGRSATIVDPDYCTTDVFNKITQSIVSSGGIACFNTSLLLLTKNSVQTIDLLLTALDKRVKKDSQLGRDTRPLWSTLEYQSLKEELLEASEIDVLYNGTSRGLDGKVRVGPVVFRRKTRQLDQDILELPFPLVEISTLENAEIEKLVSNSLATSLFTSDMDLINRAFRARSDGRMLINEPTTANFRDLPHDGHLSDFLLMERPFINSSQAPTNQF